MTSIISDLMICSKDLDVIKTLEKRDMPLGVQSSYLDKSKTPCQKYCRLIKSKSMDQKFQNQLKNFVKKKYDWTRLGD